MATKHTTMADQQKIHPVIDVEAQPQTAPLVPANLSRSDKGDPDHRYNHSSNPSRFRQRKKHHHSCCCKFFCCVFLTIIVVIIAIAATLGILYAIFNPKLPSYTVNRLRVTAFNVDNNLTAHATFDVTVTATNPNKGIGIYYENNSQLKVLYSVYELAQGSLPVFYQGHKNTTAISVVMSGLVQLGSTAMNELQQEQKTGEIPLDFRGDVPVRVKLGALKLWKVTSRVKCSLVVDSLNVSNQISIKSSSCKFSLKL